MDIVSRLKQYMEYVGMPSTQFADKAEVARPTLSQILNGRNRKISNELLEKLHAAYPNLNIMWLLFGDGDIEINTNKQISEPQNGPNLFSSVIEPITNQRFTTSIPTTEQKPLPLRNSNIDEFVEENVRSATPEADRYEMSSENQAPSHATMQTNGNKTIKTIMVFYSDSSYEIFSPAAT